MPVDFSGCKPESEKVIHVQGVSKKPWEVGAGTNPLQAPWALGMIPPNFLRRGLTMKIVRIFALIVLQIIGFSAPLLAATYTIDADHTTVSFKIRHILSHVQGRFNQFEGSFDYDPDKPDTWKVNAKVEAASIDTNVAPRDKHLRSADFFNVEKFPTLTFVSTGVTDVTPTSAKLNGFLTIHGVEKPVVFELEIHGVVKDPWGNTRSAFTATTTINRKDFGLTWNQALETGQLLVGEEAAITLEVEGLLQTKPAKAQAAA